MSDRAPSWIRHRPDVRQNRFALGAGVAVGLVVAGVVFYVARLFVAREPIQAAPGRAVAEGARGAGPGELGAR